MLFPLGTRLIQVKSLLKQGHVFEPARIGTPIKRNQTRVFTKTTMHWSLVLVPIRYLRWSKVFPLPLSSLAVTLRYHPNKIEPGPPETKERDDDHSSQSYSGGRSARWVSSDFFSQIKQSRLCSAIDSFSRLENEKALSEVYENFADEEGNQVEKEGKKFLPLK